MLTKRVSLFSLVAGLIVTPALALDSGTYAGESEDGGVLELKVKGNSAHVEVTKPGCQGDTSGKLRRKGEDHWTIRPDMLGCAIEFQQQGSSIKIIEGAQCFPLHGASCGFSGSVKR